MAGSSTVRFSNASDPIYLSSFGSSSPPRLATLEFRPLQGPQQQQQQQQPHAHARHRFESLIRKHGPLTPHSSSSSLGSSCPSPALLLDSPPASPALVESPYVTASGTQPVLIPQTGPARCGDELPVTPLTGRFPQESPFAQGGRSENSTKPEKSTNKTGRQISKLPLRLKFPAGLQRNAAVQSHSSEDVTAMPQSSRPLSPQGSQESSFFLGNLPRFHPANYQSPNDAHNPTQQSSSSLQKPHTHRTTAGARDALRQYRELITGITLPRNNASVTTSTKPSAPRLGPLGSPGPVTPLTLEEADEYLAAGTANLSEHNDSPGSASERVEKIIPNDWVLLQKNKDSSR